MKIKPPSIALIGFALLQISFVSQARAQFEARVGAGRAPIEGFSPILAAPSAMTFSASGINALMSASPVSAASMYAPAAAPAALQAAAAPAAASSLPGAQDYQLSAAAPAQSPASSVAGISGARSRAAVRMAELASFFSSRKDAALSPINSASDSARRPSLLARAGARMPSAAMRAAGLGTLLISQAHPAWASQTTAPSLNEPMVLLPLAMLAGAIAAGMVWAVAGLIHATMEIAAIDAALENDRVRTKERLGIYP
jgi:hypothetical protein